MAISNLDSPSIPHVWPAPTSDYALRPSDSKDAQTSVGTGNECTVLQSPSVTDMENAIATLNKLVAPAAQAVQFTIDEESGKTVVKVVDTETHKVLRQMPNEEALAISRELDKLKGLLIHNKA
jgi:flagellar protein FlaG